MFVVYKTKKNSLSLLGSGLVRSNIVLYPECEDKSFHSFYFGRKNRTKRPNKSQLSADTEAHWTSVDKFESVCFITRPL